MSFNRSTINTIFKDFLSGCVEHLYEKYVHKPTSEELQEIRKMYESLGLHGCIGSMDVTHVVWHRCPKVWKVVCSGKEKTPTLAFQVIVDHKRRVYHISHWFYGSYNDKTITRHDSLPTHIWEGTAYPNICFYLRTETGEICKFQGCYVLVDGGYQLVSGFINPMNDRLGVAEIRWSEWVESVRKDVECFFGILKIRWRFLRNPIVYQDAEVVSNAFKVGKNIKFKYFVLFVNIYKKYKNNNYYIIASMLHNMILDYDQYYDIDWERINPDEDEPVDNEYVDDLLIEQEMDDVMDNTHEIGIDTQDDIEDAIPWQPNSLQSYECLRTALVKNFSYLYQRGLVCWPKKFNTNLKELHPIPNKTVTNIISRINFEIMKLLEVKESLLRMFNTETKQYDLRIGDGLFTTADFPAHSVLGELIG